jgi:hypothetical protein
MFGCIFIVSSGASPKNLGGEGGFNRKFLLKESHKAQNTSTNKSNYLTLGGGGVQ